jgi:hypothetical protein
VPDKTVFATKPRLALTMIELIGPHRVVRVEC